MKKILTGLILLLNFPCFSQTAKELVYESYLYDSDEEERSIKDLAYKLLDIERLNAKAINFLVEIYGRNDQKDSINILFDRLIIENPNSPEPFVIRAQKRNAHYAGLTYTQQINYLKEACKLDSVNVEAIYTLGKLYYELFIEEFKKDKKKENPDNHSSSTIKYISNLSNLIEKFKEILKYLKEFKMDKKKENLDNYSSSAIMYFSNLCNLNEKFKETLKYPLIQLANYKGNVKKKQLYESYKIQSSYFPVYAFVNLPDDWQTNYTVNLMDFALDSEFKTPNVESAIFQMNWYATLLKALEEPILIDSLPTTVFRFTWLQSFHKTAVIGLRKNNDSITLYWKVYEGRREFEPGKIIENKSKVLTINEWNDFNAIIKSISFWSLPTTQSEGLVLDGEGTPCILEGQEPGRYHVVVRRSGGIIASSCFKLLMLTNTKIK